jgi:aminoglycoside phosphotransferase (APT) family kinase protein
MLGPVATLSRLPSGTGGASLLVGAGGRQFVAKLFAADARVLLGPAAQFALLEAIAADAIAPVPHGCDDTARLLVTEFIADAAAVSAAELCQPGSIAAIAGLLRRLHATRLKLPAFATGDYAERYGAAIGGRAALSAADRRRYDELLQLATLPLPGPVCPCHNDLTIDNLLLGPTPRLIDFDYAVTGTPALDLASLTVMNAFDGEATARLLECYYGGRPPLLATDFARVQRLVRLLAHFWALAATPSGTDSLAQYRIDND